MNGAHDMGGTHGFGPVVPEVREPTFHAEWERRVFALTMAAGRPGKWNIDMGRFARENRPPADYLNKSYYEIWLARLETLLAERGLVSADEIVAGHPLGEARARAELRLRAGEHEVISCERIVAAARICQARWLWVGRRQDDAARRRRSARFSGSGAVSAIIVITLLAVRLPRAIRRGRRHTFNLPFSRFS